MALEIERKFLVNKESWQRVVKGDRQFYRQGYILTDPGKTIRVRLTEQSGYLTIKGITVGASRPEYEYVIPIQDAAELLDNFCQSDLSKWRYRITVGGKVWEVDEFEGENQGLIVAEIELTREDESLEMPEWAEKEVTGEEKYYNSNLSTHPITKW